MGNELILSPQEENRLVVLKTSPEKYCETLRPKKVEDVFLSNEPAIGTIIRKLGEPQARAILVILIADALAFFNVVNTMSDTQVAMTVDLIIEEYPYMKTDDFKLCFKNAMKMKYGESYNRIDGQVIMGWLREYNKERCAIADSQSWNEHKSHMADEQRTTNGMFYEEYREELKKRALSGDKSAINALRMSDELIAELNRKRYEGLEKKPSEF
jgi:hypothetical protein|nr:hypothetical protein [uncultured Phocaeicola sp.]